MKIYRKILIRILRIALKIALFYPLGLALIFCNNFFLFNEMLSSKDFATTLILSIIIVPLVEVYDEYRQRRDKKLYDEADINDYRKKFETKEQTLPQIDSSQLLPNDDNDIKKENLDESQS